MISWTAGDPIVGSSLVVIRENRTFRLSDSRGPHTLGACIFCFGRGSFPPDPRMARWQVTHDTSLSIRNRIAVLTIRGPQLWPIARYVVDTPHMITKYLECRYSVVVGGRLGDIGGVEFDLGSASLLSTFNGVSAQPCASCFPGIESQIDDDLDDKRISSFLRGEDKHLAPAKNCGLTTRPPSYETTRAAHSQRKRADELVGVLVGAIKCGMERKTKSDGPQRET